ncbi:hypothetical protein B0H14DRAFT_3788009 [Mycena olivaceomarginata]|nr:hypothetical protein B0H14DRAFT_3788009 [Mycena olivaceomarginata]
MPSIRRSRRSASEGACPEAYPDLQVIKHNSFLQSQQRAASNLTTVVVRNGVTHLATFQYPLTASGAPVSPRQLSRTIRSLHCPTPTCFCNVTAKYINPIINGELAGKHAFACKGRDCSYWVVVDDILASDDGVLEFRHYPGKDKNTRERLTKPLQRRTVLRPDALRVAACVPGVRASGVRDKDGSVATDVIGGLEFIEGERPAYACQYIFMGAGYVGRMGREVEQFRTMGDCAPSWGRSGTATVAENSIRELDARKSYRPIDWRCLQFMPFL